MARKQRVEYPGALYHAANRGDRRRTPTEVWPQKSLGPHAAFGGEFHVETVEVRDHQFNGKVGADKFAPASGQFGAQLCIVDKQRQPFGQAV